MRLKITRGIFLILLLIAFQSNFSYVLAEVPCAPGQTDDCDGAYDPDNPVPIDGGASILIAAGVAYGLKKAYNKRKAKEDQAGL